MANKVRQVPALPSGFVQPTIPAITQAFSNLIRSIFTELAEHANRLNGTLIKDGSEVMTGPAVLASFTVATVPTASLYTGGMIYVSNETGGAVPAFSDGTNWRRVTDRAIVS